MQPDKPSERRPFPRATVGIADDREASAAEWAARRTLLVAAAAGHILWTADARGCLVGDTRPWCAFTGQTHEQALEDGWQLALHPDERDAFVVAWTKGLTSGEAFELEVHARRRDGAYRRLLVHAAPDETGAGQALGWIVACADSTHRTRDADVEAVRRDAHAQSVPSGARPPHRRPDASAARLRAVLDALPVGVTIAGPDGALLEVNRTLREMLGRGVPAAGDAEALGRYRAWWPDGTPAQPEERALARAIASGERVLNLEIIVQAFDGSQRTALDSAAPLRNAAGRLIGGVSMMHDITDRKRAEREHAALEARAYESEVRFRRLAAAGIIGIVVANETSILDANDAFLAIVGYTRDDLAAGSIPWGKMTPPEYAERDAIALEDLLVDGQLVPYEKDLLRKDGSRVPTLTGAALLSRQPLTWMSFALDITDRRQLEQALRDANERLAAATIEAEARAGQLEAMVAALADALLVYDREGRITDANPSARHLLALDQDAGYAKLPLGTRVARDDLRDADGNSLFEGGWVLRRLLDGEALTGEASADVQVTALDGSARLINWTGAPVRGSDGEVAGAVAIGRDVTERRRVEYAVAERASQLQTIFNAMTDGLALFDRDGRVVRMNAAYSAMLGLDSDGAGTEPASVLMPAPATLGGQPLPVDEWPINRILRGEMLTGERTADVLVHRSDGRQVILSCAGAPMLNEDGLVTGAVLVVRDVTEPRQLERERQAMLDVVTHDLKTPLTAVKAFTQSVRRRLESSGHPEGRRLGRVERAVEQMQVLVDDLQDAASLERGTVALHLAHCDLSALCRAVVDEQMAAAGRPVTLHLPKRRVWVEADAVRLSQVIRNLLSNALKYSPSHMPVVLRLSRGRSTVRLSVRDEGPGIPQSARAQLFSRYFRVPGIAVRHGPAKGVGLGLYIARRLVELHGGEIGVDSAIGVGSTFWLSLPVGTEVPA